MIGNLKFFEMKRIFLSIIILLAFQMLFAQVPGSFSYQAIVRTEAGEPIGPQAVSCRFSIIKNTPAGKVVYREKHNTATNQFGLITLAIGNGTDTTGTFGAIDWDADIYFLKVEIDPNGGVGYKDMGTTQLLSVPYALQAKTAQTINYDNITNKPDPIWLKTDENIYFNSGTVGIGTETPDGSSILDINSSEKGILLPRLTDSQRDAIIQPKEGLLIFNTTTKNFNVYRNGNWYEWEASNCIPQPTPADAGPDQIPPATTAILSANTPVYGTGEWSILSGEGGNISAVNDPASSFTGVLNNIYVLSWTITNTCGSSTDDVKISFIPDCSNGIQELDETDIDCGGITCAKCANGKKCLVNNDCVSSVCLSGICQVPACNDGTQNGIETDVDCGGGTCPKCANGKKCLIGTRDCVSYVCKNGICQVAACNDGVRNGNESGVDCGGGTCPKCGTGEGCRTHDDCQSLVCSGNPGVCLTPTCTDIAQNGTETDLNCGGGSCPKCADGKKCLVNNDCISSVCLSGICQIPSCDDGTKNDIETDVDCGGGTCPKCANGKKCLNGDQDCTSGVCDDGICQVPSCDDGTQNDIETDMDCGGGTCPKCADSKKCLVNSDCVSSVCLSGICQVPACDDGAQNGIETDVDCGYYASCSLCADGKKCNYHYDCVSGVCGDNKICNAPICNDYVKNGDETDTDCGGSCSAIGKRCANGKICSINNDCISLICGADKKCASPTCSDGVLNGDETGQDCGGPCATLPPPGGPKKCPAGTHCHIDADCSSGVCNSNTLLCSTATCPDGVLNGGETDKDCGGPNCQIKCEDGKTCDIASDCLSGVCTSHKCAAPTCSDGVQNRPGGQAETDVDCGGPCAPAKTCALGKKCLVNADCTSGHCTAGICTAAK